MRRVGEGSGRRTRPEFCRFRSGVHRAWLQQRDRAGVALDARLLWVVTPFQGQHVAVPGEDDGLPPARIALSWAITRWPTATMSSQLIGKPGAACAAAEPLPLAWPTSPRHRLTGKLQLLDQFPVKGSPD